MNQWIMVFWPSLPHTLKAGWTGAHDFRCWTDSILYKNGFSLYLIILLLFYNNKLKVVVPLVYAYLHVHLNDMALCLLYISSFLKCFYILCLPEAVSVVMTLLTLPLYRDPTKVILMCKWCIRGNALCLPIQ